MCNLIAEIHGYFQPIFSHALQFCENVVQECSEKVLGKQDLSSQPKQASCVSNCCPVQSGGAAAHSFGGSSCVAAPSFSGSNATFFGSCAAVATSANLLTQTSAEEHGSNVGFLQGIDKSDPSPGPTTGTTPVRRGEEVDDGFLSSEGDGFAAFARSPSHAYGGSGAASETPRTRRKPQKKQKIKNFR